MRTKQSFTDRVKRNQEKQGLYVIKVARDMNPGERELIDLITAKNGKFAFIRARGNGHGNLILMIKMRLQQLGKKCGARVLYARVNGENEIIFERIYER